MSGSKELQVLKIPFKDIEVATDNFKTPIGRGGYGPVYKGVVSVNGESTEVAVKRLNGEHGQGLKQFWNEVQLLSREDHQNLISLVGYCNEGNEKTIVYKYAEGGSLDTYITRNSDTGKTLSWVERLKICTDAARGLDHLHNHVGRRLMIIHRDIKSSNILIDGNRGAKISDLGLSKLNATGVGMSLVVSHYLCGTEGYWEPDYLKTGILTKKTDVYSFGIVLFEVLCGKLCLVNYNDGGFILSSELVKKHKDSLAKIIHPSLSEHMGSDSMIKFSAIAYKCLNEDREQRPAMDVVKKELEEALELEKNPKQWNLAADQQVMNVETPPLDGPKFMNVVLVAAECTPWSKTGGLGDVVGALPRALAKLGHRVMVVVPIYGNDAKPPETDGKWYIVNEVYMEVYYFHKQEHGVDFVFIQNSIFEKLGSDIYGGNPQDILRSLVLFCKAAIEAPWHVVCGGTKYSDENLVFIANDWHTALLPVYLKAYYHEHGYMKYARSVLVIHNIDHQGRFRLNENFYVDLPQDYLDKFKTNDDPVDGDHYNILAAGLKTAHGIVTALSHGYAPELKTHEGGQGLNGIITENDWKSKGTCIVNGIDKNEWNTEVDLSWENVANQYQDVLFDAKKKK